MARKRMISPDIWQSEDFSKLSTLAKIVFIGMFSNADDEGRGRGKAVYLKSIIFPYDEDIRVADVDKTLSEISSNMSVIFYSHNENVYYELTNWNIWQKVEKPQPSKIPAFIENDEEFQLLFGEQSGNNRGRVSPNKNKKRIEQEENRKEIYSRVVDYLNEKAGTSYKATTKTMQEKINARLDEGFSLDDFIVVINNKCDAWLKDAKMCKYLRPETLFGNKFESYLNEISKENTDQSAQKSTGNVFFDILREEGKMN